MSIFKETLAAENPFVAKMVHDIKERLQEVYGTELPRPLDSNLDYIVSQTYQATVKHISETK